MRSLARRRSASRSLPASASARTTLWMRPRPTLVWSSPLPSSRSIAYSSHQRGREGTNTGTRRGAEGAEEGGGEQGGPGRKEGRDGAPGGSDPPPPLLQCCCLVPTHLQLQGDGVRVLALCVEKIREDKHRPVGGRKGGCDNQLCASVR